MDGGIMHGSSSSGPGTAARKNALHSPLWPGDGNSPNSLAVRFGGPHTSWQQRALNDLASHVGSTGLCKSWSEACCLNPFRALMACTASKH